MKELSRYKNSKSPVPDDYNYNFYMGIFNKLIEGELTEEQCNYLEKTSIEEITVNLSKDRRFNGIRGPLLDSPLFEKYNEFMSLFREKKLGK